MQQNPQCLDQVTALAADWGHLHRQARRSLRIALLKRGMIALLPALLVTAGLTVIPRGARERLVSESNRLRVYRVERQYGWPRMLLHTSHVVRDSATRQMLEIDPRSLVRGYPLLSGEAWRLRIWISLLWGRVDVPWVVPVYVIVVLVIFVMLAYRPMMAYRLELRALKAESCAVCGYPKTGLPGPICPECGTVA